MKATPVLKTKERDGAGTVEIVIWRVPEPHFSVGFEDIGQMLAVFTPKRWELIGVLRASGPLTVAELARRLRRDYKNVHGDVQSLMEWMTVERDDQGRVFVPWSEIIVDMHLPKQAAA
jgi:predicted transcriptional regulator